MKFRFCGDCDCPDWVLAEIHSSLSMFTSVKLKILTQLVVNSLLGDDIPESKLKTSFPANKNDPPSIKAAMSCIRFLMVNATRFQTDDATFSTELQQLGLPVEHSAAVCRVFKDQDDSIDCACVTFKLKNELIDGVPTETNHRINIGHTDIKLLLKEMKTVRNLMQEME